MSTAAEFTRRRQPTRRPGRPYYSPAVSVEVRCSRLLASRWVQQGFGTPKTASAACMGLRQDIAEGVAGRYGMPAQQLTACLSDDSRES